MSESEKAKQPPSVSRNVHYNRPGTTVDQVPPVPAIIAAVLPAPDDARDAVQLFVMDPVAGAHFVTADYSEKPAPGKWSYPPYVAPAIVDKQPMATVAPPEKPTAPPPADKHPDKK